jgi:PTH1 family peptidyl-tRNA hydrolase
MNLSGEALEKFCRFFKISSKEIIVVCDEISLELGTVKITSRSGTAGHNGVRNILSRIGPGFIRFRVGVGRKKSPEMILSDYVLSHFDGEELELLGQKIPKICDDLQLLLDKGISGTMNGVGEDLCKQDPTGQP